MFVSDEVGKLLAGGEAALGVGFPDAVAHALIDSYLTGGWIDVSLNGRGSVDLERMRNVDEVWLFCFRRVSDNQWRIMGRFSNKNKFVGLKIHRRPDLTGKAYERKANEFISDWNEKLNGAVPLRGDHWSDYLSPPVRDKDKREF